MDSRIATRDASNIDGNENCRDVYISVSHWLLG